MSNDKSLVVLVSNQLQFLLIQRMFRILKCSDTFVVVVLYIVFRFIIFNRFYWVQRDHLLPEGLFIQAYTYVHRCRITSKLLGWIPCNVNMDFLINNKHLHGQVSAHTSPLHSSSVSIVRHHEKSSRTITSTCHTLNSFWILPISWMLCFNFTDNTLTFLGLQLSGFWQDQRITDVVLTYQFQHFIECSLVSAEEKSSCPLAMTKLVYISALLAMPVFQ